MTHIKNKRNAIMYFLATPHLSKCQSKNNWHFFCFIYGENTFKVTLRFLSRYASSK